MPIHCHHEYLTIESIRLSCSSVDLLNYLIQKKLMSNTFHSLSSITPKVNCFSFKVHLSEGENAFFVSLCHLSHLPAYRIYHYNDSSSELFIFSFYLVVFFQTLEFIVNFSFEPKIPVYYYFVLRLFKVNT